MKKVWVIVLIVFGVFILLGAAAGIGVYFLVKTAVGLNDVAQNQLELLRNGDIEAAYEMTSDEFKEATSLAEFEEFVASSELSDVQDFSLSNVSQENGILTITGTVSDSDSSIPIQVVATKEGEGDNAEWKIVSIELSPSGFVTENDATEFDLTDEY